MTQQTQKMLTPSAQMILSAVHNRMHISRLDLGSVLIAIKDPEERALALKEVITKCPEAFKDVIDCSFAGADLTQIPEEISNIKSIQKLNLSQNKLKSIPASIGDLPLLIFLNLSDNELESIPEEIGNRKLIHLNAANNKINRVPDFIKNWDSYNFYFDNHAVRKAPIRRSPTVRENLSNLF